MNDSWIKIYCKDKKCADTEYKAEWEATVFKLGGKMFGMLGGDANGNPIMTLKLEPSMGQLMRNTYADITPGYYMNKEHWNSIALEGTVPDDVIRSLIDCSYELIKQSLSKKLQKELSLTDE